MTNDGSYNEITDGVPDDIKPTFTHNFEELGHTVQLRKLGTVVVTGGNSNEYAWWYKIVNAEGETRKKGKYVWPVAFGNLSDEIVAAHLMMSWEDIEVMLKKAKEKPVDLKEEFSWMLTDGTPLDRARYLVWVNYYANEPNILNMDRIKVAWLVSFVEGWKVVLFTEDHDERLYEVVYVREEQQVYVNIFSLVGGDVFPIDLDD